MIRVFYGDDRVKAKAEIDKILGNDYEVIDAGELSPADLPSIFMGASLLSPERKILLRDFTANKAVYEKLPEYLETPHTVVLFETKLDKRSAVYKELKDRLDFREFKLPENQDFRVVFDIYKTAKRDGKRAVEMLRKIEPTEDPMMFFGLLVSQAIKDYAVRPGEKEKNVLKRLSEADMQMKTTKVEPWLLVESILLRLT